MAAIERVITHGTFELTVAVVDDNIWLARRRLEVVEPTTRLLSSQGGCGDLQYGHNDHVTVAP